MNCLKNIWSKITGVETLIFCAGFLTATIFFFYYKEGSNWIVLKLNEWQTHTILIGHQALVILYKWQTLATGIMALCAAFFTIKTMERHHNDHITRKRESLRSYMNDALSALSRYCEECFEYIQSPSDNKLPEPNPIHIEVFKNYIEYEPNKKQREEIRKLISFYQVYNSRLKSFEKNIARNKNDDMNFDTIELNARVLNLFAFARCEVETIATFKPELSVMTSSLNALINHGFPSDPKYEPLMEMLKKGRKIKLTGYPPLP